MWNSLKIIGVFSLLHFSIGCKSSDSFSAYRLAKEQTFVYKTNAFMFKTYFFTFTDGEATLVYMQDAKLSNTSSPVFLKLKENKESKKYQEFTDSSRRIVVKIINENEVRLQLDKVRHTLTNQSMLKNANPNDLEVLAEVAYWKEHYH